jgi:hypothetical protein
MPHTHLLALEKKCREIAEKIREELHHPAHDAALVQKMKKEKLRLEEEIFRAKKTGS